MIRTPVALAATLALAVGAATSQAATPYPSDTAKPDLIPLLSGYDQFWQSSGVNDLHGTVEDARTLERNDRLTVFINNGATPRQRFRALQDSEYDNDGKAYDQSITISDGLGSALGTAYVRGRKSGALPLTSALINSQDGTTGAYVGTGDAKAHFSHPRPYLPVNPAAAQPAGDETACSPSKVNASSLAPIRVGRRYAGRDGTLDIQRVPDATDGTHAFSPNDVRLSPGYGTKGICTGGSFPSGHTTTAYQAGFTLATLLPELAPQILARASEAGNNRIVLGVHYPLDIVGGRIDGEVALAARWSDTRFRTEVLQPAREELVRYLEHACGTTILRCAARSRPYTDNPYGGRALPGGSAQIVDGRASASRVYRERLSYGFARVGPRRLGPAVPAGAENLLLTAFPTLSAAQRQSILAQTQIPSGYPLDRSSTGEGSWQRLDLAAALSAKVRVRRDGSVRVLGPRHHRR